METSWKANNVLKSLEAFQENKIMDLEGKPCLIHSKNNVERSFLRTYAPDIKRFLEFVDINCYGSISSEYYLGTNWNSYKRVEDLFRNMRIPQEYIPGWIEGKKFKAVFTTTYVNNDFLYYNNSDSIFSKKGDTAQWALPVRTFGYINNVLNWHWREFPLEDQKDFLRIFHYLEIIDRGYYIFKWYNELFGVKLDEDGIPVNKSDIPDSNIPPFKKDIFMKKLKHLIDLEAEIRAKPHVNAFNFIKNEAERNKGVAFISGMDYLKKCINDKNFIGWTNHSDGLYMDIEDYYKIAANVPGSEHYIVPEISANAMTVTCDFVFNIPLNKVDVNDVLLLNPKSKKTGKHYEIIKRIQNEYQ